MKLTNYILDTSVFIHDPKCLRSFNGCVISVPIYVIMELDNLKESPKAHLASLARQASHEIIDILQGDPNTAFVDEQNLVFSIVSPHGKISIKDLELALQHKHTDLLILKTALEVKDKMELEECSSILLSRDINLRILANSLGLVAEDYSKDATSPEMLYKGYRIIENNLLPPEDATLLTEAYWKEPVSLKKLKLKLDTVENEYILFKLPDDKTLIFRCKQGKLHAVDSKRHAMQIKPRNEEQRMALDLLMDESVQLVSLIGKAGTGKTLLTLASALAQSKRYSRILLSKPVIDLGKGIGFLPGDMGEKMAPWMASYYDNLDQIPDLMSMQNAVLAREELLEKYKIELNPINYVRGRSLKGAFMVIDEAQNLTQHEIKSIITRAGEGTKVVLLGDPQQIDVSYLDKNNNGLAYVTTRMKGQPLFGSVSLKKSERSSLADIAADVL